MLVEIVLSVVFSVCVLGIVVTGCINCLKKRKRHTFTEFPNPGFIEPPPQIPSHGPITVELEQSTQQAQDSERVEIEPLPDVIGKILPPQRPKIVSLQNGSLDANLSLSNVQKSFPRENITYLNEIGTGWFGRAIESEALRISGGSLKSRVVVKILKDEATKQEQAKFMDEVTAFRCVEHPNILNLLGQCTEEQPFLVILDYAALGTLKSFLVEHKQEADTMLKSNTLINMAINAASGIACLHRHDYIHCDIAARNCLVMENKTLKIGDYGISDTIYRDEYFMSGRELLPIRWMAPDTLTQQSQGDWHVNTLDKTSDIWSFGVFLWEMFTLGEFPYSMLSDEAVLQGVIVERVVALAEIDTKMPYLDQLSSLVKNCFTDSGTRPTIETITLALEQLSRERVDSMSVSSDFDKKWSHLVSNKPARVVQTGSQMALAGSFIDSTDTTIISMSDDSLDVDTSNISKDLSQESIHIEDETNHEPPTSSSAKPIGPITSTPSKTVDNSTSFYSTQSAEKSDYVTADEETNSKPPNDSLLAFSLSSDGNSLQELAATINTETTASTINNDDTSFGDFVRVSPKAPRADFTDFEKAEISPLKNEAKFSEFVSSEEVTINSTETNHFEENSTKVFMDPTSESILEKSSLSANSTFDDSINPPTSESSDIAYGSTELETSASTDNQNISADLGLNSNITDLVNFSGSNNQEFQQQENNSKLPVSDVNQIQSLPADSDLLLEFNPEISKPSAFTELGDLASADVSPRPLENEIQPVSEVLQEAKDLEKVLEIEPLSTISVNESSTLDTADTRSEQPSIQVGTPCNHESSSYSSESGITSASIVTTHTPSSQFQLTESTVGSPLSTPDEVITFPHAGKIEYYLNSQSPSYQTDKKFDSSALSSENSQESPSRSRVTSPSHSESEISISSTTSTSSGQEYILNDLYDTGQSPQTSPSHLAHSQHAADLMSDLEQEALRSATELYLSKGVKSGRIFELSTLEPIPEDGLLNTSISKRLESVPSESSSVDVKYDEFLGIDSFEWDDFLGDPYISKEMDPFFDLNQDNYVHTTDISDWSLEPESMFSNTLENTSIQSGNSSNSDDNGFDKFSESNNVLNNRIPVSEDRSQSLQSLSDSEVLDASKSSSFSDPARQRVSQVLSKHGLLKSLDKSSSNGQTSPKRGKFYSLYQGSDSKTDLKTPTNSSYNTSLFVHSPIEDTSLTQSLSSSSFTSFTPHISTANISSNPDSFPTKPDQPSNRDKELTSDRTSLPNCVHSVNNSSSLSLNLSQDLDLNSCVQVLPSDNLNSMSSNSLGKTPELSKDEKKSEPENKTEAQEKPDSGLSSPIDSQSLDLLDNSDTKDSSIQDVDSAGSKPSSLLDVAEPVTSGIDLLTLDSALHSDLESPSDPIAINTSLNSLDTDPSSN